MSKNVFGKIQFSAAKKSVKKSTAKKSPAKKVVAKKTVKKAGTGRRVAMSLTKGSPRKFKAGTFHVNTVCGDKSAAEKRATALKNKGEKIRIKHLQGKYVVFNK
jgi:hypothetical protein